LTLEDDTLLATATITAPEVDPLIDVYFADGEFAADDIQLFLDYLAATYRELGGSGLKAVEGQTMVPEEAKVPR
jgi:hypothetical protein